jgi:hypothetical protein
VNNELFRSSDAAATMQPHLDFLWHLTSRAGMSISQSDLDEIKQAHRLSAAALDAAFEGMLRVARSNGARTCRDIRTSPSSRSVRAA